MSDEQEVTLGEVYRAVLRCEIKIDKTNGKVARHESELAVLKDRGSRDDTARWGGAIGTALAALSAAYAWWRG